MKKEIYIKLSEEQKEEEEKELSKCCHAPLEEISQGSGSELNWCSRCGDRCEVEIFIKK